MKQCNVMESCTMFMTFFPYFVILILNKIGHERCHEIWLVENEVLSITEETDKILQDLQSAMANHEEKIAEKCHIY